MGIYTEVISARGLGTGTAKTQLSGDRTGNAASWIIPAGCRGIIDVTPYTSIVTPTANETAVTTLKVESDDLGIKDFEVFAVPLGTNVATTDTSTGDLARTSTYPLYFPTNGGEKVDFFGIPQTANTAQPFMGAMVRWTDNPAALTQAPYRARVGGAAGGAASGTSTGTTAAATGGTNVVGATITLSGSGQRVIKGIYGVLSATTQAAVKPISGWMSFTAPEMQFTLRAPFESAGASLGTAQQYVRLTRWDNLNCPIKTPSTIQMALQLEAAPSTAGNFYQGILYQ